MIDSRLASELLGDQVRRKAARLLDVKGDPLAVEPHPVIERNLVFPAMLAPDQNSQPERSPHLPLKMMFLPAANQLEGLVSLRCFDDELPARFEPAMAARQQLDSVALREVFNDVEHHDLFDWRAVFWLEPHQVAIDIGGLAVLIDPNVTGNLFVSAPQVQSHRQPSLHIDSRMFLRKPRRPLKRVPVDRER